MSEPLAFLDGRIVLYPGDCLEIIKTLADNSVDACVTDPPYALGFMGKKWDTGDAAFSIKLWREVRRVLKPGAHVVAFAGTRTYHRIACAIEDAGFEIRDQLGWCYGSGFPKSHSVALAIDKANGAPNRAKSFNTKGGGDRADEFAENGREFPPPYAGKSPEAIAWGGWGTALKPAWEPICLARKPLSEATVAANVLKWGTGALNIDATRVPTTDSLGGGMVSMGRPKVSDGWDRPWMHDAEVTERKKGEAAAKVAAAEALGRWPANIIHDGSAEVLAAFPDADGARAGVGPQYGDKSSVNAYGNWGPRQAMEPRNDSGSAARFFYSAKADADDRLGSKHPTVKPVDLMQWLCRLVTPPGGTILDPFAGTGTTGEAAWREGFSAMLIEREAEYQGDIARRMSLCLSDPATRSAESAKARYADKPTDHGPLFGGAGLAGGADRFTAGSQTRNRTDRA